MKNVEIRVTTKDDLENVKKLWNNGDVMKFVGFPEGLGVNLNQLERWLDGVNADPYQTHFSIYHDEIGYCGESHYAVDIENKISSLDIKLFNEARGKGIARYAFEYAIEKAFETGKCERVYVDPSTENKKAWELYEKIGFKSVPRPSFLEPGEVFLELRKADYFRSIQR